MSAWLRTPTSRSRLPWPRRPRSANHAPAFSQNEKGPEFAPGLFCCRFPVGNSLYVMHEASGRFAGPGAMTLEWVRMGFFEQAVALPWQMRDATPHRG